MPENAAAIVLLFLLTAGLLATGLGLLLWMAGRGRLRTARRIGEAMAVILVLYAGSLLTFSLTSRDALLEPGQQKYLCEIDCHLAYSVEGVEVRKSLGAGPGERKARGSFYVVTVRTWFDGKTVSAGRGNAPLRPNPRRVQVEDDNGRVYLLSEEGQAALRSESKSGIPLDHALRPGESYSTSLAFDLPPGTRNPRLLIAEDLPVTRFLIGHENSFLHGKIWFRLVPEGGTSPPPPEGGALVDTSPTGTGNGDPGPPS
jgi:hypothetical protein